jgi:hypothetical protein
MIEMDLITMFLKLALKEPGCPICRIKYDAERRYLFNLLYENVNDVTTRTHLAHGLGLCPRHTWDLQATEQSNWNDGMGTGIIYEGLTGQVLNILSDYLAQASLPFWRTTPARLFRPDRLRGWLEQRGRVGRWLAQQLPPPSPAKTLLARLTPSSGCRVCEITGQSEQTYLEWLARLVTEAEFRAWYAASDGLCLPHLRRALAYVPNEEAAYFLAKAAADRLTPLHADLKEYSRKHNWKDRNEPKYPWEQASWIRASAFFGGEAQDAIGETVDQARRQAMTDYRSRPASADPAAADSPQEEISHARR